MRKIKFYGRAVNLVVRPRIYWLPGTSVEPDVMETIFGKDHRPSGLISDKISILVRTRLILRLFLFIRRTTFFDISSRSILESFSSLVSPLYFPFAGLSDRATIRMQIY